MMSMQACSMRHFKQWHACCNCVLYRKDRSCVTRYIFYGLGLADSVIASHKQGRHALAANSTTASQRL